MISYSCLISTYYLLENLPTFQNSHNFSSDNLTHLYKYLHFKSPTFNHTGNNVICVQSLDLDFLRFSIECFLIDRVAQPNHHQRGFLQQLMGADPETNFCQSWVNLTEDRKKGFYEPELGGWSSNHRTQDTESTQKDSQRLTETETAIAMSAWLCTRSSVRMLLLQVGIPMELLAMGVK